MDREPREESVDDTLQMSVLRVKTSRELLAQIDQRLERSAELLQDRSRTLDLRDPSGQTD